MSRVHTVAGILFAVLMVSMALGACGKKQQPKAPEGATYPRQYPAP